jgi:Domain of unknown function (DUF4129)
VPTPPELLRAAVERLAIVALPPRPDPAVRDALEAVFRRPEYARSVRETLWARFARWLSGLLRRLFADTGDHLAGRQVAIALLIALGLLIAARILWGAWQTAELRRSRTSGREGRGGRGGDPWAAARAEAAAGRYVAAAHALYQALLAGLAERTRVRLHPSKTAGDYVRDLRAQRSAMLPPFREFARAYAVVAYGTGECDRARYERLLALATATLEPATPSARRGAA